MEYNELYILLSRLFFGGIAVFLSILVWAKTRDTSWMLVVLGIILSYSETVYTTLEVFGLIRGKLPEAFGFPIVRVLFVNASVIMFSIALGIMIRRRDPR